MADPVDATTYTMNFAGTGTLPTAGSFIYDPDTSSFTNFSVTWIGLTFDLISSANAPSTSATIPSCLSGMSGGAASFALLSGACSAFWGATSAEIVIANFTLNTENNFLNVTGNLTIPFDFQPKTQASGGWTITAEATPVPEPSSLFFFSTLLLSAAFVARKRIA